MPTRSTCRHLPALLLLATVLSAAMPMHAAPAMFTGYNATNAPEPNAFLLLAICGVAVACRPKASRRRE